jgi:hypothetical protein
MKLRTIAGLVPALLISQTLLAQGPATPPGLQSPPPGRLQERIATLPPAARARALDWLARFDFPVEDIETIDIDLEGGVLYADPRPDLADPVADESGTSPSGLPESDVFALHSKPGAANVVFVDVDGHTITGTAWNAGGAASYAARAYDTNGNTASFSQSELDQIADIWHRVAEDLAPFDIDVTTEEPNTFGPKVGRILVTRNSDANGVAMPYAGGGGVAYVNVFGQSNYTYYQPALVYYNNLGGGQPRYVAEASSHELGHNLGLSHDGTTTGVTYYGGHGAGLVDWAPIMGNSYGAQVTQWSRGDYANANNSQNDFAIIAGKLSLRDDDHSDFFSTATPLQIAADGIVYGSDPEVDPFNTAPGNKGLIEELGDVDVFSFSTAGGLIDLDFAPAWVAYRNDSSRGANLDILATLYNANGVPIASNNPATDTFSALQVSVPDGVYYIAISAVGTGNPTVAYDDYGSQGQYFINGVIAAADNSNLAPVAVDDFAVVDEDGQLTAAVLDNDRDDDGGTLSIVSLSQPGGGSASTDGVSISYTPDTNTYGSDSLNYVVSDGQGGTASATLVVTINAINDAPNAVGDSYTVDAGGSTTLNVLANDNDVDSPSLTIVSTTPAVHGTVTIQNGSTLVYTADPSYTGSDAVDYTIVDGDGASAIATVALVVRSTVPPPATPTALIVSDNANGTATINWRSVVQVQGYEIQRETKHKKRNSWNGTTIIATLPSNATSYIDNPGTNTFRYRIRAFNSSSASAWSSWATITVTNANSSGGGGGKGRPKR